MKTASIGMALWLAMSPVAVAQTGGYPASPSHGVVGSTPDGTPRYGREPGKQDDKSAETVGRVDSQSSGDQNERGSRGGDGAAGKADAEGTPQR